MILNPPQIQILLRTWKNHHPLIHADVKASYLSSLFRHFIPAKNLITYAEFIQTYHLYLQQIPQALAQEAWGLIAADLGQPKPKQ